MTLDELLERLRGVGLAVQRAAMATLPDAQSALHLSLEYLNAPRNSLQLRWKPEALAAVRRTFELLNAELRVRSGGGGCGMVRPPTAYELIEGRDAALSAAFAETTAYVLASTRMAAPAYVPYINVASRAAVGHQVRVALQVLLKRWVEYATRSRPPHFGGERANYFR